MRHPHPTLLAVACLTLPLVARPATEAHPRLPGVPLPRPREARLEHPEPPRRGADETIEFPLEFRSMDGWGNHLDRPELGTPGHPMPRLFPADDADGASAPAGVSRPSARAVSNAVAAQDDRGVTNRRGATDFLWQWGQFLDHDIVETPTLDPPEPFDIAVPPGDPWFDPFGSGTATIPLDRSYHEEVDGVRQQVNEITSFIDASNVYGSDDVRGYALRALDGSGRLKTTPSVHGDLLPYNDGGHANAPDESATWFLAGDIRANEQVALTALHTLFVREHNHWAGEFRRANPAAAEDETYEFARMIVGAEVQVVTYREFLPLLLGPDAIPPYRGYSAEADSRIANEFATAAFRLGHSLLPAVLRRIDADGATIDAVDLPLAEAFFNPTLIEKHGIDPLLRGLAAGPCQELDGMLVDDVRNFLFGPPGSGGLDLAALNIQRGRDHGLPSYNAARRHLGLRPARDFRDVHPDPAVHQRLAAVYASVDDVDLWVGGLCEPHVPGAMVGPVFHLILRDQFIRLRDGDRFWHEAVLAPELMKLVAGESLASVIRRNTAIGDELPDEVFVVGGAAPPAESPGPPRPGSDSGRLHEQRNAKHR